MITSRLKLSKEAIYQTLYLVSMGLYHSSQFSTIGADNQQKSNSLLSIINNIHTPYIAYLLIFITTLMILSLVIKTYLLSTQNYFIEIMERVFFPILLYVMGKLVVQYKQNMENSNSALITCVLIITAINAVILLMKNLKITFRYSNNREMGFVRLMGFQYIVLVSKIVVTLILGIFLPNNLAVQIITTVGFNIIINLTFAFNIIYQHPNAQYLCLLTQFYLWIPVISMTFLLTSNNSLSLLPFNLTAFITYIALSFTKPKLFIILLQKKYYRCFHNLNLIVHSSNSSNSLKTKQLVKNLIPIVSVYIYLFFQIETNIPKLTWSDAFKTFVIMFVQQKNIKENFEIDQNLMKHQSIYQDKENVQLQKALFNSEEVKSVSTNIQSTSQKSISQQSQQDQVDLLQQLRKRLKNPEKQEISQSRDFTYEFLWNLVYPYISSADNNFKDLRIYVSYIFPDKLKNMKFRLFYSYYFNNFQQLDFCSRLQARICYKYLTTLVGNQLSDQRFFGQFQQNIKRQKQKDCLLHQNGYHNQKFNELMKQRQIHDKIVNGFQKFFINQQLYVKIFQNIKQHKQTIRPYYKARQQLRIQLQQTLLDYGQLKNKNKYFFLMSNYMKDYFLHKNEHTAYLNFKRDHAGLITQKRHYLRQHITGHKNGMTFNQKVTESIRQNCLMNKSSDNLICVISGIKNRGQIKNSSPKFKQLMQISCSDIDELNIQYLNNFHLPLWRDRHSDEMRKVELFEKPVDHEDKRYFIVSRKQTNLLDVKFKMYFFVKYQTDLLLVLDIQYHKINYLQIQDHQQNSLYTYDNSQTTAISNIERNRANSLITKLIQDYQFDQQNYVLENVLLFEKCYQIKTRREKNENVHESEEKISRVGDIERQNNKRIGGNFEESLILQEKQILEKKFISFKMNFTIYHKLWSMIRIVVLGSILFFIVGFQILKVNDSIDQSQALSFIQNKILIQNKIISLGVYQTIEIGILFKLADSEISFNNPVDQTKFLAQLFNSLAVLRKQINQKAQLERFDNNHTSFTDHLYQSDWITGYNVSLMLSALKSQKLFIEALAIFINPEQLLIATSNQTTTQNIQLPKSLSFHQQTIIANNIYDTISSKKYYFGNNGVMDQIYNLQSEMFNKNATLRTLLFVVLQFGFTIFSIFVIFFIITLKKFILNNYNNTLLVSVMFRKKFQLETIKLQKFIIQLKKCSQSELPQKIQPQKILYQLESKKLTYVRKYTGDGLKTSIWNKKGRFEEKEAKLNLNKFLFESVLFPFLRYFMILGSVFHIYQSNVQNLTILQEYSNSLSTLGKLNIDFMMNFGVSLYRKKFESKIDNLAVEFQEYTKQIRQIDKIDVIYDLFPFNPEFAYSVLYDTSRVALQKLGIHQSSFSSQRSFLQETNSLLFLQKSLFNHFLNKTSSPNDTSQHLIDIYEKVSHLYWFLDNVTEKSYELLNQQIQFDYTSWFIGLMVFLIVEFLMGSMHFNEILDNFNKQYLNIGTYEQMKRQVAFGRFVNLSSEELFIKIDQNPYNF